MRELEIMSKNPAILYKTLVVGVIVLFIGVDIQPAIETVELETEIDFEPKDYLFQILIDMANDPDVKDLLEKYRYDLLEYNIDRSVYRKFLLRNPILFRSLLSSKPSMSVEYFQECYDKGIQIINTLGEEKTLELFESVGFKDKSVIQDFNKIIENDEVLSDKINNLATLDLELESTGIIEDLLLSVACLVFFIIFIPTFIIYAVIIIPIGYVVGAIYYLIPNEEWKENLIDWFLQFTMNVAILTCLIPFMLMYYSCYNFFDWY
jgi:hypothetical protein